MDLLLFQGSLCHPMGYNSHVIASVTPDSGPFDSLLRAKFVVCLTSNNSKYLKILFMRKLHFVKIGFLFLLSAGNLFSQESQTDDKSLRFFNRTEAGVSFGIGSFKADIYNGIQENVRNDEIVVTLQTINGFRYMNRVAVGVSAGAELWQNGLFWPVYGYLGYDFKPADNNFFADIFIGYAFGNRDSTSFYHYPAEGAFAFTIGVGYKMKVAKNLKFMYEVFYKYQEMESSYNRIATYEKEGKNYSSSTKVDYKIPLSFAGFKIGIFFP